MRGGEGKSQGRIRDATATTAAEEAEGREREGMSREAMSATVQNTRAMNGPALRGIGIAPMTAVDNDVDSAFYSRFTS